jgi:hypothetical protein
MVNKRLPVKLLVIFMVTLISFISSCDLFWGMPWGKSANDPTSQIGIVRAVNAGDGKIAVAWDWRPFLKDDPLFGSADIDSKRKIVELRVLHGVNSPPIFSPPLPFGDAITDRLDPDGWYMVFEDLKEDREHYFSVYGKEESGQWVGPWTSVSNSQWAEYVPSVSFGYDPVRSYAIPYDDTGAVPVATTTPTPVLAPASYTASGAGMDPAWAALIVFDNYGNDGFIDEATLAINISTFAAAGSLKISALRFPWEYNTAESNMPALLNNFTIDDVGSVIVPITVGGTVPLSSVQQKLLVSRMALFGSWMILIQPVGGVDVIMDTFQISFSFWRN